MTDIGKTIKPTVREYTRTWMVQDMKASGKKTNNMEKVWKLGLMAQVTRVITWKARSTVLVNSLGLMAQLMKANSLKIILTEEVTNI